MAKELPGNFRDARTWKREGEIAYREGQKPIPPKRIEKDIEAAIEWGSGYIEAKEKDKNRGRRVDRK